jgi:hypothetical protein
MHSRVTSFMCEHNLRWRQCFPRPRDDKNTAMKRCDKEDRRLIVLRRRYIRQRGTAPQPLASESTIKILNLNRLGDLQSTILLHRQVADFETHRLNASLACGCESCYWHAHQVNCDLPLRLKSRTVDGRTPVKILLIGNSRRHYFQLSLPPSRSPAKHRACVSFPPIHFVIMVLELHIWGPAFGLPSIDPECLAVVSYLGHTVPQGDWTLIASNDATVSPDRMFTFTIYVDPISTALPRLYYCMVGLPFGLHNKRRSPG